MIPEWAPNIHPLVVHFPIALLCTAVCVDGLAYTYKRHSFLLPAANGLYALGAVGAVAAFLTGRAGADALPIPGIAFGTLTDHADWAQRTAWFYGIATAIRLALLKDTHTLRGTARHLIFLLLGIVGLWPLYETGEHGAELVFRFGVGVASQQENRAQERPQEDRQTQAEAAPETRSAKEQIIGAKHAQDTEAPPPQQETAPQLPIAADGSWVWTGDEAGFVQLGRDFVWLTGTADGVVESMDHKDEIGPWVNINIDESSVFFAAPPVLGHVQAALHMNMDGFEGRIRLVHHMQNTANYNYMELDGKNTRLGEVQAGTEAVQDVEEFIPVGWFTVKAVGHKTHFRGYIDDQMVVHGHGPERPAGRVGVMLEGRGTISISRFETQALD